MKKTYNSIDYITNHHKELNISNLESKLSFLIKNHNNGEHIDFNDYRFLINKYGIYAEEKPNKVELSKILQKGIDDLRKKECSTCSKIATKIVKEYSMYLSGRIL